MAERQGLAAHDKRRGTLAFWWLSLAMTGITLACSVAGVVRTCIGRVTGLGSMTAQARMRFWFAILVLGVALLAGVALTVVDSLAPRPAPLPQARA